MIYLSESYSKEKKERKEKIENDRKAQEKSQQEEADRSAKSQQEILDYQNGVQKLAKNAGYANDFFSEKFIFYSFYTNTYDIFQNWELSKKAINNHI